MPAGILQINQQAGNQAQALEDDYLEGDARRQIRNIQAKMEQQDAAWNLAGRTVGAGIQTYKDWRAGKKQDKPGQDGGVPDSGSKPGYDDKGEFHPVKDFAANFANPNSKYANLQKAMRGQPPQAQTDGAPTPAPLPAGSTPAPAPEQKPPLSAVNHENAAITGSFINQMLSAQPTYLTGPE